MRGIKHKHHNVMYRLVIFLFFLRKKEAHLIDQPKGHELVPKKVEVFLLAHMYTQGQTGNEEIVAMEGIPALYC